MAAIKGGNGEYVHEGKHKRDKSCEFPEAAPIPGGGEKAANGAKRAYTLYTVGCEHIFQVVYIARKYVPTMGNACGNTFKQTEFDGFGLVCAVCHGVGPFYAHLVVCIELEVKCVRTVGPFAEHYDGGGLQTHAVGMVASFQYVVLCGESQAIFVDCRERLSVVTDQLVSSMDASFGGRTAFYNRFYFRGKQRLYEARLRLDHLNHVEIARQTQCYFLAVAKHSCRVGFREVAVDVGTELRICLSVCSQKDVAVAESELLGFCVELKAMAHIADGNESFAPCEEYGRIEYKGKHKVDKHAANHDQETLPCWFCTKFPWFHGLLHLLRVHRFVYHARNLDVTAEGQPPDAVGRVAPFRFELKRCEPRVEEKAELLHAYLEEFGEEEVTSFVKKNEQREACYELYCSDEECFHVLG